MAESQLLEKDWAGLDLAIDSPGLIRWDTVQSLLPNSTSAIALVTWTPSITRHIRIHTPRTAAQKYSPWAIS